MHEGYRRLCYLTLVRAEGYDQLEAADAVPSLMAPTLANVVEISFPPLVAKGSGRRVFR